jgi:peroxiredoxin
MLAALALGTAGLLPGGMAQAALGVGDKAPAFALPATTAKQVSSKDFAGKTLVLFFYTGAFTNS